jgi:FkbM family methyltransferase
MSLLARLPTMLRQRYRALRLGVLMGRTSRFQLPRRIRLGGRWVEANFPDETGVRVAFLELLLSDCYGLCAAPRDVRTVLDVGANVGIFCLAARAAFPRALIHAYEPNRALEPYLSVQARHADSRVFYEAVTREGGTVSLDVQPDSVQSSTRATSDGTIPATAFRETVRRLGGQVDFAKVDCEGAEWEFLDDVDAWRGVREVAMEYHVRPGKSHADASDALARLGFVVESQQPAEGFGLIHATRPR